jgi:hypothetical protein
MRQGNWIFGGSCLLLAALLAAGCNRPAHDNPQAGNKPNQGHQGPSPADDTQKGGHDYSGWWCVEHGVPEHLCSLCLSEAKVKTMFKDKGDWCELHDRAKSQCFKCDPKKYEKFEAMYRDKFGKAPPRPPAEEFQK